MTRKLIRVRAHPRKIGRKRVVIRRHFRRGSPRVRIRANVEFPLTQRKELARDFFIKRFGRPPESDPLYFQEWEKRINTYDPGFLSGVADKESMDVLKEVKKKYPSVFVPGLAKN